MKKLLLLLTSFMLTAFSYSQYDWTKATVYLKNGEQLVGEGDLRMQNAGISIGNKDILNFRKTRKDKKKKFDPEEIDSIRFTITYTIRKNRKRIEKTRQETYIPVFFNLKRNKMGFVQLIVDGNMKLVGRTVSVQNGTMYGSGVNAGGGIGLNTTPTVFFYPSNHNELMFLKDNQEPEVFNRTSLTKSFRKRAMKYFEGCSSLVKKINSKAFKKEDLIKIAEYYNAHCGN